MNGHFLCVSLSVWETCLPSSLHDVLVAVAQCSQFNKLLALSIDFICDALDTHRIPESDLCVNMVIFDNVVVKCASKNDDMQKQYMNERASELESQGARERRSRRSKIEKDER